MRAGLQLAGHRPELPRGRRVRVPRSAREGRLMVVAATAVESRSPGRLALRRFFKNRRAVVCIVLLAMVGLATLIVPWVTRHNYRVSDWEYTYGKPNGTHWFGTDALGRDLMVRVFLGGRISFAIGFLATAVSVIIGVAYGATSAFAGGRVDALMMRFVDILYGLPHMLVVIVIMSLAE